MSFPSGGQELEALTDHRIASLARGKVQAGELRSVFVEEDEEGEGDEGNEEEEKGEIKMLHVVCLQYCCSVLGMKSLVFEGFVTMFVGIL